MTPTLFGEFSFPVAVGTHSLWVASAGVMSEPPASLVGFWVAAPSCVPPLSGDRRPLTHSPPHGFWATRRSGVD